MKVTGWTNWENDEYERELDDVLWDLSLNIEEAVIIELKEKGYKFSGWYHQNGDYGCPIIDNKYLYNVSMRKWGNVMARALDLPNEYGMAYVSWAWSHPSNEKEVYPKGE